MNHSTKRVYFVLSAGWGPVIRALPIANALKESGVKTYFHVSGKAVIAAMTKAGHELMTPVSYPQKGEAKRDWWTLDQLLYDFGWNDPGFVENRFSAYCEAIKSVRPDVLVVDFNTTAMLVARVLKIPTVAITQSCFHPNRKTQYIVWWKDPPASLPTVTPTINKILSEHGLPVVACAEELQTGDVTVIPSFPEFDPLDNPDASTRYVGPLLGNDETGHTDVFGDHRGIKVVVYPGRPRDMGGESGALIMRTVVPALEKLGIPSVVSKGAFDYPEYSEARGGVSFAQWVSLPTLAPEVELMVHHGGHGACLSSLTCGLPSLVIPTFAEREYNARNLEKLGSAISLPPELLDERSVENMLSRLLNTGYKEKASYWKDEIARRQYGGFVDVLRIIRDLL